MKAPGAPGRGCAFLLTDYGTADEFAGVVRAVLAEHAPAMAVVDLTHEVPPFDVRAGALMLRRAVPHLGPGVVMAVVDPGVAGLRRAVALAVAGAEHGPRALVGPDNGLLPWAADELGGVAGAVGLAPFSSRPSTFDGRDLFAPAVCALWRGAALGDLGPPVDPATLVRLDPPHLLVAPGRLECEVLWVDRFGNVQLAATAAHVDSLAAVPALEVVVAGRGQPVRVVGSFDECGDGLGLLVDANGHAAIVTAGGSAATVLDVRSGARVELRSPKA